MDSGLRRNDPAGNPLIVTRRACNPADTLPQPPIPQMLTHLLGNHTYPSWHYYFIDPRADAGPRVKAPKCEGGWAKSSPPPRIFGRVERHENARIRRGRFGVASCCGAKSWSMVSQHSCLAAQVGARLLKAAFRLDGGTRLFRCLTRTCNKLVAIGIDSVRSSRATATHGSSEHVAPTN